MYIQIIPEVLFLLIFYLEEYLLDLRNNQLTQLHLSIESLLQERAHMYVTDQFDKLLLDLKS